VALVEERSVSLRRRLVAGMLALLVAAVVVADLVTSSHLRSFLIGRLDEQIDVAQAQAYTYLYTANRRAVLSHDPLASSNPQAWLAQLDTSYNPACGPPDGTSSGVASGTSAADSADPNAPTSATADRTSHLDPNRLASILNPDVYVEVITASGQTVYQDPSGSCTDPDPAPVLPSHLPVQAAPRSVVFGRNHGVYVPDRPAFEVSAVHESGPHYRVQAVAVPGGTLVIAISLDPTNRTLASLAHVELAVSLAVFLALLVLVLWIVRLGLRPLDGMTETARAIAGGDLTRRIQRTDERSEVGRLGAALNGMLSQIEAAFQERATSESRLRRFVADASHELRTPLTSIRGYAELLRKGALNDEESRSRASERIEHEAARMTLLVDDLLLLARLDQGRPFDPVPVDLAVVVAEAVDAVRTAEPSREFDFESSGEVIVDGDAARLRQVVDNLLRNAVVHTPSATPVHVSVSAEGWTATVSVADEGPGIEPEEQLRVFDRFYRGNASRTGGGTGLGLSIVAAIAEAHGGTARVRSAPSKGATFVVEIPLRRRFRADAGDGTRSDSREDSRGEATRGQGSDGDGERRRERVGGRSHG
jgi:two-component system OmpR family sensor kinase